MKINAKKLIEEAKKRASNLMFDLKNLCFPPQYNFVTDKARFKAAVCSRRCLAEGTLVRTEIGPKKIEDIKIGDKVYSEFGKLIKVKNVFSNGPKEVIRLTGDFGEVKCTADHMFYGILDGTNINLKSTVSLIKAGAAINNTVALLGDFRFYDASSNGDVSIENTYDIHVESPSNLYTLENGLITHNSGKTVGIILDLINTCINEKDIICLYVTITTKSARSIVWSELKRYIETNNIEVKTDETRLTIKFIQSGSEIRLGGAKDEVEIEKYRGWKLRKVYIDEAQYFRPYLTYFINDILMPALRDLRGDLAVTGTPGPVLSGPFYEITHNRKWSQHHWTAFDNPHMLDLELTLKEEREVKGITEDDPGYIRETYGKWIEDANSLVYKFDVNKNVYKELSDQDVRDMDFIFGIDIGYDDSDAIAVLGYNRKSKHVFLVDEFIKNKMGISELVGHINRLREIYKPVKLVMDAGALGKKIQEEIRTRHSLHIEAAEKVRKMEFIELLNDDLRTGKFKAKENSRFQQDCFLVQWEWVQGKKKISDTYHTDIGDAVLYAWRECKHFTYEAPSKKVHRDSVEFMDALEEQYAEQMEREENKDEFDALYDLNQDIDE
jgi:hypothetical protein